MGVVPRAELELSSLLFPQVYFRPVWASYRELMRRTQVDAIFMMGSGPSLSGSQGGSDAGRGEEGGVGEGTGRGPSRCHPHGWSRRPVAPPPHTFREGGRRQGCLQGRASCTDKVRGDVIGGCPGIPQPWYRALFSSWLPSRRSAIPSMQGDALVPFQPCGCRPSFHSPPGDPCRRSIIRSTSECTQP